MLRIERVDCRTTIITCISSTSSLFVLCDGRRLAPSIGARTMMTKYKFELHVQTVQADMAVT
jgi:hypothetical protein